MRYEMGKCWGCCCKFLRRCLPYFDRRLFVCLTALYAATFFLILPMLCWRLRHSAFELLHKDKDKEQALLQRENTLRLNKSLAYLHNYYRRMPNTVHNPKYISGNSNSSYGLSDGLYIAVTIITMSRTSDGYKPMYLTQVVSEFLTLISDFHERNKTALFVCNVDLQPENHNEIYYIPKWIKIFEKYTNISSKDPVYSLSVVEKEKRDYVYCLEQTLGFNSTYILLVEDDAVPRRELFPVLFNILKEYDNAGIRNPRKQNVTFFKLYHPERLLGYISLEVERIPELISICVIVTSVFVMIYVNQIGYPTSMSFLCISIMVYSCLVLLVIGRQNLIELRRMSKFLYQITPAPSCCTPAMLYTNDGARIVSNYLNGVNCYPKFGKDTAIDTLLMDKKLNAKLVQPNLFKHIGLVSAVRGEMIDPYVV
ncbi:hypothetical protein CHS0354_010435 [Potamilus streckersoni]|uniref:Uncharacterized protein n=1 Tax=Potamilus streckersoni TaxID=2493646 RepID=A0AAE0SS21_9BIVA|nr:hypothetical protein CHS0354_010435 [Potamilus streckersoni]